MNVNNMYSMFRDATSFNQNLAWDTGNVLDMASMFMGATSMQGDLSLLDTSKVFTMAGMFSYSYYNRDISMWDVEKTALMTQM